MQKYFHDNIRDWHWWFKIFLFIIGVIALLLVLISELVNMGDELADDGTPRWAMPGAGEGTWDYDSYLIMFFSFFTHHSVFMVLAWVLWAIIYPKREGQGRLLGFNPTIFIMTYISITAVIWTLVLFPALLATGVFRRWYNWLGTGILHILLPLAYIFYVVFGSTKPEENKMTVKKWLPKSWLTLIYPLVYGLVMILRYEARMASGYNGASSAPYFFLQINETTFGGVPNAVFLLIAIILIGGLAIGFSTLYVYAFERYAKAEQKKLREKNKNKPAGAANMNSASGASDDDDHIAIEQGANGEHEVVVRVKVETPNGTIVKEVRKTIKLPEKNDN